MARFNLFPKLLCPSCFEQFYLGDCDIVSTITTDGYDGYSYQPRVLHRPRSKFFSRIHPESLNTPNYTKELACRKCPHCGYLLPPNIGLVDDLILAIVGDTFSGKSCYIAALIHQLERGELQPADKYARFDCLTQEVGDAYRKEVINPLFEDKTAPPATQTQPIGHESGWPLIYELIMSPSPGYPTRRVNLILYDREGGELAIKERLVTVSRYVLNSNAIIFLADPLEMLGIVGRLPPHLQPRRTERRPSAVLNGILSILERYIGERLYSIPLAIVLPKSDLLQHLQQPDQTYTFLHERAPSQYLDLKDQQTVEHEVKGILEQYGDRPLLSVANAFWHVGFFAVAPIGHPPNEYGHYPAVEPIRCLDPLLWILWKLKFIDAR